MIAHMITNTITLHYTIGHQRIFLAITDPPMTSGVIDDDMLMLTVILITAND